MPTLHSYGIIPIYKAAGEVARILCVKNKKSGQWGLPKGTPDVGESPWQTACRELEEETGIRDFQVIEGLELNDEYPVVKDGVEYSKTSTYYIAFVPNMQAGIIDKAGITEIKWQTLTEARELFVFPGLVRLVGEVEDMVCDKIKK